MPTLTQKIADRLRAGALVIVVQEPDELLAYTAALPAAALTQPVEVLSASNPDISSRLEGHKTGQGTLILLDFLCIYGDNPLALRLVREIALQERKDDTAFSRLILIERPEVKIPAAIIGDVEIIAPSLPTVAELQDELQGFIDGQAGKLAYDDETRYALAGAVAGLARHEAARLFARCLVEQGGLDAAWLRQAKAQRVAERLGGALTFESVDSVLPGGCGGLRRWLAGRKAAFASSKAREYGLPEPKGILLVGVPGCGKSLTARTVAREWGLPLLRLDAGRLFGSLVGQSESQTRQAIQAAEACAPCVLWIDEIEKGLAGGGSGSSTDGGTTQRVFGALLTWLQEKTSPVFVVATANRIAAIPPEMLRKGRFDEIFFIGLPTVNERREIAKAHLDRRKRDGISAPAIAEATEGFSGAEIEQAIIDGLFSAYGEGRELTLDDVTQAAKRTVPLSRTMPEEIKALEVWAKGRARPASDPPEVPETTPTTVARRRAPAIN